MSKKLFSLAPLASIVAFALMPAAAHAAEPPHWYVGAGGTAQVPSEGSLLKEAKPEATITWGGTQNLSQESGAGTINCKTVGAGEIENPKGSGANVKNLGPAGVGKTQIAEYYECAGSCKAAIEAAKAAGSGSPLEGVPGEGVASAQAEAGTAASPVVPKGGSPELNWTNKLETEPAFPSEIAEVIGAPPGTLGEILATVFCVVEPEGIVAANPQFEGELKPQVGPGENGGGTVASPAFAHFNLTKTSPEYSGELPSKALPAGSGGRNEGNVKYEGYGTNSYVRVKAG